jgi:cytochrome c556
MQKKISAVLAALTVTTVVSYQAFADTSPEDAADYRKAVMTSMGGHVGAASMIVRGLVEDDGHLAKHAEGLANGAQELDRIFQEGSNVEDSEALPVIWEEPEAFAEAISKAQEATAAFVAAAETGDREAIGAAFRNVGMSCRGCHDNYRVEHD